MVDAVIPQVTGRGRNVNFAIDDSLPLEEVVEGLRHSLAQHPVLYSRGSVTIEVGRRMLAREELTEIKRVLESESGLTISQFWCSPETLETEFPDDSRSGLNLIQPAPPRAASAALGDQETEAEDSPASAEAAVCDPTEEEAPAEEGEPELRQTPDFPEDLASSPPVATPVEEEPQAEGESQEAAELGIAVQTDAVGSNSPEDSPSPKAEQAPVAEPEPDAATRVPERPAAPRPDAPREPEPNSATQQGRTVIDLKREMVGLYRGNEALLVKTTCRSGEVIRYPGDIVVLADVNPGAEIIADGDILVYGTLRGMAHAGAGGNIQATIIALRLEAPRVRIGPHTGMAPPVRRRSRSSQNVPMMAYVRRQHIFVAPFAGRFAIYNGGTLYDG